MMAPVSLAERLARAVLLFHRGGPWTEQDREVWLSLTGTPDATTRTLCDLARQVRDGIECWFCPVCETLRVLAEAMGGDCCQEPPREECPCPNLWAEKVGVWGPTKDRGE
jgi:hypothetical protein